MLLLYSSARPMSGRIDTAMDIRMRGRETSHPFAPPRRMRCGQRSLQYPSSRPPRVANAYAHRKPTLLARVPDPARPKHPSIHSLTHSLTHSRTRRRLGREGADGGPPPSGISEASPSEAGDGRVRVRISRSRRRRRRRGVRPHNGPSTEPRRGPTDRTTEQRKRPVAGVRRSGSGREARVHRRGVSSSPAGAAASTEMRAWARARARAWV